MCLLWSTEHIRADEPEVTETPPSAAAPSDAGSHTGGSPAAPDSPEKVGAGENALDSSGDTWLQHDVLLLGAVSEHHRAERRY